ncbi:MAG: zinc ribbon domain-containing protein [Anaerolineae bacterium]|nr:zinc ribbon domain-containing protein [Anaerolineae bacterium]
MSQFQKTTGQDWLKTIVFVVVFVAIIIVGAIFLLPAYWYVWLALVIGGLFWLVSWHAKQFAYRCANCGHEFEISALTDLVSPHGIGKAEGWKYLKCPNCQQRTRAAVLKKVNN